VAALAHDRAMVGVLWRRDMVLFFRQRSRLLEALAPPLLLWAAIGAGVAPSFHIEGTGVGYLEYFFPGILLMLLWTVSMSATMSVIEDRKQGFLQGVLVAPGSRAALVVGKSLGSTTVGLCHGLIFLLLAPLAGYSLWGMHWIALLAMLALVTLAMTAGGFALAWWLDSVQAYHGVMFVILIPLWVLSGALFPARGQHAVMHTLLVANPLTYGLSGIRRAMYGGTLPRALALPGVGPRVEFAVVGAAALACVALATFVCVRNTGS
jgi:ABC-type polysaccharide/polyol phosphate export permease